MAIMELNACRNELAWDILAIDDMDVLRTAKLGKMNSQGNEVEPEFTAGIQFHNCHNQIVLFGKNYLSLHKKYRETKFPFFASLYLSIPIQNTNQNSLVKWNFIFLKSI